jgi:hypothetical protein
MLFDFEAKTNINGLAMRRAAAKGGRTEIPVAHHSATRV